MLRFWQGTGLYLSAGKCHERGQRCEQRARVSSALSPRRHLLLLLKLLPRVPPTRFWPFGNNRASLFWLGVAGFLTLTSVTGNQAQIPSPCRLFSLLPLRTALVLLVIPLVGNFLWLS